MSTAVLLNQMQDELSALNTEVAIAKSSVIVVVVDESGRYALCGKSANPHYYLPADGLRQTDLIFDDLNNERRAADNAAARIVSQSLGLSAQLLFVGQRPKEDVGNSYTYVGLADFKYLLTRPIHVERRVKVVSRFEILQMRLDRAHRQAIDDARVYL